MRTIALLLAALSWTVLAQQSGPDKSVRQQLPKGTAGLSWQVLNINNLWTWHRSDGEGNHSPGGEDGLGYPIFTARAVYEDNLVFGGIMYVGNWPENGGTKAANQPVRVNGGTYLSNHGMVQGWVEGTGATANYTNSTNDPRARIYRIRRDFMEMTDAELLRDASIVNELLSSASASQAMKDAVLSQYWLDWEEWPVEYGAPFIDRNGNGVYDKPPGFYSDFTVDSLIAGNYDEPGIAPSPTGIPADQVLYTVYHGLDRTKTLFFSGSEPIGLEVQKTVWGYKSGTELPNHYFVRYRFINKGGVNIGGGNGWFHVDSLFIGQWADIDIGNAGDDLYGCDTVLQMAYAYNGNATDISYERFSLPPPSTGYTILGGPLVPAPGDSGLFGLQRVYGKKNLPMTAFAPEKAGDAWSDPPFADYERGAGRWWKMLRGFLPLGTMWDSVTYYPHPPGYPDTPFPFAGDPVTQTGHIDGLGNTYSPTIGDVRILASSGPSRLALNDTAEFIVGVAVGLGADRLSSISVMKKNIATARKAFKASFEFARAPEKPGLTATALNREIILDWGNNNGKIERTETTIIAETYLFEGYNVYQLPTSTSPISEGVKLATFDRKNGVTGIISYVFNPATGSEGTEIVQNGTDSGIQRFLKVNRDRLTSPYGEPIYNGREYFFGVTAYNYTSDPLARIRTLESEPAIVSITPQIPFGVQINTKTGDTVAVTRTSGNAEGSIQAIVYDPLKTTGDTYEVRFDTTGAKQVIIRNASAGLDLYRAQLLGVGESLTANVDGVQITLVDKVPDFRQFFVTANALGPLNPPELAAFPFNSSGFPKYSNGINPFDDRPDGSRQQSSGLTSSNGWGIHAGGVGTSFTYSKFKKIVTNNDSTWGRIVGYDFELRFTAPGGQARNDSTGALMSIPFELWNVGSDSASASDDYRMIPVINDRKGDGAFDYDGVDHSVSGADDDPETDWISWYDPADRSPGQTGYDAWVASGGSSGMGSLVMADMVLVLWNGGSVSDPTFPSNVIRQLPETGTVFRILSKKPFGPNDVYSFISPSVLTGADVVKSSARRVGVYPNPYFGGWNYEGQPRQLYVTFNNLPPRVKIRIFNLAGHLVRTLEKNDQSQFLRWDLTNEHNWQIGSGVYICHVEMPEIGETKIIKFAVVLSEAPPTY